MLRLQARWLTSLKKALDCRGTKRIRRRPESNPARVAEMFESRTLLSALSTEVLNPFPDTFKTFHKPQSKVWQYDNTWWAAVPNGGNTNLWRLDGTSWSSAMQIAGGNAPTDVKVVGNVAHVLLADASSSKLASLEYNAATDSYGLWSQRPSLTTIDLTNAETATIDIDSTGRMWAAWDDLETIKVAYSDAPYSTFSPPIILETGVSVDDINVVTAMPNNTVGVMWSNQTTERFGFKVHVDGADPQVWSADEVPASQSAQSDGGGMADDHLNLSVAADGTLFAAVKTSYNSPGATAIALLVRRPNGQWDDLYHVDDYQMGSRPMVIYNQADNSVLVAYRDTANAGPIVYRASDASTISFTPRAVLIPGAGINNPTSVKANWTTEVVVLADESGVRITNTITNNVPVALGNSYAVDQAQTLTVTAAAGVLTNDSDADGQSLTAVLATGPSHGTLTLNSNGSLTYVPTQAFHGTDQFTYRANDGIANSNLATVTITVSFVNQTPVAVADSYVVDEDTSLVVAAAAGLLANDTDIELDPLTVSVVTPPASGTLTLNANGSFTYLQNANFFGSDSFTYAANDGTTTSAPATVTLTVNAINDVPVAVADSYVVLQNTQLAASGVTAVVANDLEVDGDPVTAVKLTNPAHGTVTFQTNGSFTYQPAAGYIGSDSFTYRISDGVAQSNTATVQIQVKAAPVAAADAYSATEDTPLTITAAAGVLANDTDADTDPLTAVLVTAPANGTVTLSADGSFSYTPAANFSGTDSFTYRANDGSFDSAAATVLISVTAVNDAPVAVYDAYSVDPMHLLVAGGPNSLLANDTDVDSNSLIVSLVTAPTKGTLVLNANGSFSYTPSAGFSGTDSFSYTVSDGAATSNVATVTLSQLALPLPWTHQDIGDVRAAGSASFANGTFTVAGSGEDIVGLYDEFHFAYQPFTGDGEIIARVTSQTQTNSKARAGVMIRKSLANNSAHAMMSMTPGAGSFFAARLQDGTSAVKFSGSGAPPYWVRLTRTGDTLRGYTSSNGTSWTLIRTETVPMGETVYAGLAVSARADGLVSTATFTNVSVTNESVFVYPNAVADSFSVNERSTLVVNAAAGVLGNDLYAANENPQALLFQAPQHGTLTFNADGSFTYQPQTNYVGGDAFSYWFTDSTTNSNIATVDINVVNVNDPPAAEGDSYTVAEQGSLTAADVNGASTPGVAGDNSVLANDSDPDGDLVTAVLETAPAHGSLTWNANGTFTYTHDGSETTSDSFSYHVSDSSLSSGPVTVTITVTPVNDAPVARDDDFGYTVPEGGTLTANDVAGTIAGQTNDGVLVNDTDAENDALTATLVTPPAHGTVTLQADGSFTYTHDGGETTSDSFTYRASDGAANSPAATVLINITPVNDAPQANADGYTVAEGALLTITDATGTATPGDTADNGVLVNDADAENNALTAVLVADALHGQLTLNPNGTFTYQHDGSETSSDSFTYRATDGNLNSSEVVVTLTITPVNDAPVATGESFTLAEGGTLSANDLNGTAGDANDDGLLLNDSDNDGDSLTVELVTGVAHGTLSLQTDGSFTYTHDGGETTADNFTYRVLDGTAASSTVTVELLITPVNDPPVGATDSFSLAEAGALTADGANRVLINDTDADTPAEMLTAVLVTSPDHGTLTLNTDGSFTYTHDGGETTADSFVYRVSDGSLFSAPVTVALSISPVNDAPIAIADSYTIAEGSVLSANDASGVTGTASDDGLLPNDTDAEGNSLIAVLDVAPIHGELTLNTDGTFAYLHDGGESTADSFSYYVSDGMLDSPAVSVAITITPVNDPPVAQPESFTVDESGVLLANDITGTTGDASNDALLLNDSDIDGGPLRARLAGNAQFGVVVLAADGTFAYLHDGTENFSDSFTYVANDGSFDSNVVTVSITILPENDNAPVAVAEAYSVAEGGLLSANDVSGAANGPADDGVLVNDSDADRPVTPLFAVLVTTTAHGDLTLNSNGTFTYQHDGGEALTDSFTYRVSDGTLTGNVVNVAINITPVNDAPVAVPDAYIVAEGGTLTIDDAAGANADSSDDGLLLNDTDAENDLLTAIVDSQPLHGTLSLNADGTFTYTHDGGETTGDSFAYHVTDGTAVSTSIVVTITITPVNDAPVTAAESFGLAEGGTLEITDPLTDGLLANDTDVDGDTLTAVVDAPPSHGTLTLETDGTFTYQHDGTENFTDSFAYHAFDGQTAGNVVTVDITIAPVNDNAPVGTDDAYSVSEGATLTLDAAGGVLANDSDIDLPPDTLTVVLDAAPLGGTLTWNADGSFEYTHGGGEAPTDHFVYHVTDGTFDSAPITATISIAPVNDAPVAIADAYVVAEGGTLAIADAAGANADSSDDGLLVNDTDAENDALTAIVDSQPLHGTLSLNPDGTFTYSHDGSETTGDSFTYHVTDGAAASAAVVVTITITPVNDAPQAVGEAFTVAEGATFEAVNPNGLLANDSDADLPGDTLTAVVDTFPAHGLLTFNADGTFSYVHDGSETTGDSFEYHVTDGAAVSNSVVVTITITPVNDAPVAAPDAYVVAEGGTLTIDDAAGANADSSDDGLLLNDTDAENDLLTAIVDSQPLHGTLSLNADGTFTYTHDGGETTGDSFAYHVTDGTAVSTSIVVTITITPVNDAPVTAAESFGLAEGGTLEITDPLTDGLLANDTDVDGDTLTAVVDAPPSHGTLTLETDGTFTYQHDGTENFTDSFAYHAFDGQTAGNVVTVDITIAPVNDNAPVGTDDAYSVSEGATLTLDAAGGVLANDSDIDLPPDTLTVVLDAAPLGGTLTWNADGSFEYTHGGGEAPTDHFVYHVTDGTFDSTPVTATISIAPVNDAPVSVAESYAIGEGQLLSVETATGVLSNDTDAETTPLTAVLVTGPAHGTLSLNADGSFEYQHDGSETQTDGFVYTAGDGELLSQEITVTISVTPINDEIPVANGESYSVLEGGALAAGDVGGATADANDDGVLVNDTDEDIPADTRTAELVDGPHFGTLTLHADGTFTYQHDGSQNLSDSFTYQVSDGVHTSAAATVSFLMTEVNDAPVAAPDSVSVAEGATLTAAPSVLANDADAESSPLTAVLVSGTTHGTLTLYADGSFDYQHDGTESTTDSFTYFADDGSLTSDETTVTISINPVNDRPVAAAETYTAVEAGTLTAGDATGMIGDARDDGILANDVDAEGVPLKIVLVSTTQHGLLTLEVDGTFTYVHDGSETLSDSFSYLVNDGELDSAPVIVTINITPMNDAPRAVADSYFVAEAASVVADDVTGTGAESADDSVALNDSDAEGSPLTVVLDTPPSHGTLTLNDDGTFAYTHDGSETTTDTFSYHVSDGALNSNVVTVLVSVHSVNDAPIAAGETYSLNEAGSVIATDVDGSIGDLVPDGLLVNDVDSEAAELNVLLVDDVAHGILMLNADGSFIYVHNGDESPTDGFTYRVTDGDLLSDIVAVTFDVAPVNDNAPVGAADSFTLDEGAALTVPLAASVLTNDTDADFPGELLTAVLVTPPIHGQLTWSDDGTFLYTHDGEENFSDSFTYRPHDGLNDGNLVTVTLTIQPVNDNAPVGGADAYSLDEGGLLTVDATGGVLSNDTDADQPAVPLAAVLVGVPSHGALTLNGDGSFDYQHDGTENLADSFTYRVSDGELDSELVTVTITITPINDNPPVAVAESYSIDENGTLIAGGVGATADGVLANDTDTDRPGDRLTAELVTSTLHGTLTWNGDGSFIYSHGGEEIFSDSFVYRVNDGSLLSEPVTVTIAVMPVNDNEPMAETDTYSVAEGGTFATTDADSSTPDTSDDGVLANDSDADLPGDVLTAVLLTSTTHGLLDLADDGTFSYTHDGGESREDSFTYQVSDGLLTSGVTTVVISISPVNDQPDGTGEMYSVAEGGTLTTTDLDRSTLNTDDDGVLANDTDVDGDTLSVTLLTDVAHGTLTLNSDGTFSYTHDDSETHADSFVYRIDDGTTLSEPVTVTIEIAPVNDNMPESVGESYTVDEGGLLDDSVGVLANDTDVDVPPDVLTAHVVTFPAFGTLTLNANGTFSYQHDGSENHTDSFTYFAHDGLHDGHEVTVSITVTPINDNAPVANPDTFSVLEGATLIAADASGATAEANDDGVLRNDTDADLPPDSVIAVLDTTTSHGTLTLAGDGTFTYVHDGGETRIDSFTYHLRDGAHDSNVVTATIVVAAVNDQRPIAVGENFTLDEGATLTIDAVNGLLTNDADGDVPPDSLTIVLGTEPAHGTLTLNGDSGFTYQHDGSEQFADSFTYRVNDGVGDSNEVTVAITVLPVNDNIPIGTEDAYSVSEGGTLATAAVDSVLVNDTDADRPGNLLTTVLDVTVQYGTLTLNPDGTFTYTHDGGESTSDSFSYRIHDGLHNSGPIAVNLTVTPVNDRPEALGEEYAMAEGGQLDVELANGLLSNDSDADGDLLTAQLVTGPAHGTLTLNTDGTFRYQHDGGETTADSFIYRAHDGIDASNEVTVLIAIAPVNDPPVGVAESYSVDEHGMLTAGGVGSTADGVLANDTDADLPGDLLTAQLITSTAHGSLTWNGDGSFTYTHGGDEIFSDSFVYRAFDGNQFSDPVTVTIAVTPVNDVPVALGEKFATVEEGTVLADDADSSLLHNDTDADGDALSVVIVSGVSFGTLDVAEDGTFAYQHDGSETTQDSFTYRVTDGTALSDVVTVVISIQPVNDHAPVAVGEAFDLTEGTLLNVTVDGLAPGRPGLLANDSDTDVPPDTLTVVLHTPPQFGTLTLAADGSFTYQHGGGETPTDSFTYAVTDGVHPSDPVQVVLTITPVNDNAPVAADRTYSTSEGAVLDANDGSGTNAGANDDGVLVGVTDADIPADALTAVVDVWPQHGSLTFRANGTFSYAHDGGESTSDSFVFHVRDGIHDSAPASVTIDIAPVNDAPLAVADAYSLLEGDALVVADTGSGLLANDTDADGDLLTVILDTTTQHGLLTIHGDGTFTYQHDGTEDFTDNFTYHVDDGGLTSGTVSVQITITPVNDAPVASGESLVVAEAGLVSSIDLLANETDAEGNSLMIVLNAPPARGQLTLNLDGSFSYQHDGSETTTDSFRYSVTDGGLTSNVAIVTIQVTPVNDIPVAVSETFTVAEGGILTATDAEGVSIESSDDGILANDSDGEGGPLTAELITGPAYGLLVLSANGTFTYTHDGSETTADGFTYRATDGAEFSNVVTVTLDVTPINDAPAAAGEVYSTVTGETLTVGAAGGVLANDADVETVGLTSLLETQPAHGWVVLGADGSFRYTPNGYFTGTDTFTYRANDGGRSSNVATVTINVTDPVGLPRPWTNGDVGTVSLTGSGRWSGGTFTLTGAGVDIAGRADQFNFSYQTLSGDGEIVARVTSQTFTNTRAKVGVMIRSSLGTSAAHALMSLSPDGRSSFIARLRDGESTQERRGVGVVPYWVRLKRTGSTLTGSVSADGVNWTVVGSAVITLPEDVFVGMAVTSRNAASRSTATMDNVTVAGSNQAPTAADDLFSLREIANVSADAAVGVLANDADAENDPVTAELVGGPLHGMVTLNANGSFQFAPSSGFTRSDSFAYRTTDGRSYSNVATVHIVVNNPPVGVGDLYHVGEDGTLVVSGTNGVLTNDSDADSDALTANLATRPEHGTILIQPDGAFQYVPAANFFGLDRFTYRAGDGVEVSSDVEVTIVVDPLNDLPATSNAAYMFAPGETLTVSAADGLPSAASDVDGDPLTFSLVSGPSDGTLTLGGDGAFVYEPGPDFLGTDSFQFLARDAAGDSNASTVTVTQTGLPHPWVSQDVGAVRVAGTTEFSGGMFTIQGAGTNIGSSVDSFQFVYQPIAGDVEIIARVNDIVLTHSLAKAGVMIRGSLDDSAPHAFMSVSPSNKSLFISRSVTAGASTELRGVAALPEWIRLVRTGNTLTGYVSDNGTTWSLAGSVTIALPDEAFIGLAVTSRQSSLLTTATISDVRIETHRPTALAASVGVGNVGGPQLTPQSIDPLLTAAVNRWADQGLDSASLCLLQSLAVHVADLGGVVLAVTSGSVITLDDDAAGHGWFIDATPADDAEFIGTANGAPLPALRPDVAGQTDLLTILMHELGHVLGFDDNFGPAGSGNIMSLPIPTGQRRIPTLVDVDQVFSNQAVLGAILFGEVS